VISHSFENIAIISDCHIYGPEDALYSSLLRLIAQMTKLSRPALVLAGDIFDVWVGDKQVYQQRYLDFLRALFSARDQGLEIFYIQGNHDFLIQMIPGLSKTITIADSEVALQLGEKKLFIAHGDLIDPRDYRYRILRFAFRSFFNRGLVRVLPGSVVDQIGQSSSRYGRDAAENRRGEIPLSRVKETRALFRNFAAEKIREGFDVVVLGHCHDRDEMAFKVDNREGVYFNVGYPRVHGSYLIGSSKEREMKRVALA